jgi:hypothetical protein
VIIGLMRWADTHLAQGLDVIDMQLTHRACGAPTQPYLACSHCHQPVTGRDVDATVRRPVG